MSETPYNQNGEVPSIRIKDIQRSYISGKIVNNVLKGNTFDLYPGKLTLIMGPSGSGKSTLLSVISGLLEPDSGTVHINDTDIWQLAPREVEKFRLDHFGFIFQGFNLFASLTALEQILIVLKYVGKKENEAENIAEDVLREVGLGKVMHLKPMQLSGGEKQRVAIARALAKKPEFLFADEDGVAGIVAALGAHDHIRLFSEHVDDLAFAFIAPLGADHD